MSEDIINRVQLGLTEANDGTVFYTAVTSVRGRLDSLWNPRLQSPAPVGKRSFLPPISRITSEPPPKRPPPWYVGMSSGFSKDVAKIDRKLQGRILEALVEIAENPTEAKGDTVKPLVGELKGCWRYRIADHRLIYSPDRESGNVTLLAFASRGSAYFD